MAGLPLNRYVAASECSHARSSLESGAAPPHIEGGHITSTISKKASSRRTSTTPRSIRCTATCSPTTASSRSRVASAIPIAKGKVEAGVGHAKKTPLRGLRFETIEEAQAYLDRWEAHWADTRIHGTTKREVAVMFAEENSPRAYSGPL